MSSEAPWWASLEDEDPVTLEPLASLLYPPFTLGASHFDGLALAEYLCAARLMANPLTRQPLTRDDCERLDVYLAVHNPGETGGRVVEAFEAAVAASAEAAAAGAAQAAALAAERAATAAALLRAFFTAPLRRAEAPLSAGEGVQADGAFSVIDDDQSLGRGSSRAQIESRSPPLQEAEAFPALPGSDGVATPSVTPGPVSFLNAASSFRPPPAAPRPALNRAAAVAKRASGIRERFRLADAAARAATLSLAAPPPPRPPRSREDGWMEPPRAAPPPPPPPSAPATATAHSNVWSALEGVDQTPPPSPEPPESDSTDVDSESDGAEAPAEAPPSPDAASKHESNPSSPHAVASLRIPELQLEPVDDSPVDEEELRRYEKLEQKRRAREAFAAREQAVAAERRRARLEAQAAQAARRAARVEAAAAALAAKQAAARAARKEEAETQRNRDVMLSMPLPPAGPPPASPPPALPAPMRPPPLPRPDSFGDFFFWHSGTGESSFVDPGEAQAEAAGGPWRRLERGFWTNTVTGESSWDEPRDVLGYAHDGKRFWVGEDGVPSWAPPVECAWKAHTSQDGKVFYHNAVSEEVTWAMPASLGWKRVSLLNTYWWNCVTGVSVRPPPPSVFGYPGGDPAAPGRRFFLAPDGVGTTWEAPACAVWTERDVDGRPWFFNLRSREAVWERPAESNVAWRCVHEDL